MVWFTEYPEAKAVRDQTEKAMRIPLGMASPLWLAFGAAASAGVGWWWMTRWTKAANLEAMVKPVAKPVAPKKAEAVKTEPAPAPAVVEAPVVAEAVVEEVVVEAAPEPIAATPAPTEPDDLTVLVGIGPKLAEALAARGVTQYAQVAAWTDEEVARIDHEMKLLGRAARNEWVAQAKRLVSGKA